PGRRGRWPPRASGWVRSAAPWLGPDADVAPAAHDQPQAELLPKEPREFGVRTTRRVGQRLEPVVMVALLIACHCQDLARQSNRTNRTVGRLHARPAKSFLPYPSGPN